MLKSSTSVQLVLLGSGLSFLGCSGNSYPPCQLGSDGKPMPLADGSPNPNCSRGSRSYTRTGGIIIIPGIGGGGATRPTAAPARVTTGGFGKSGGGVAS